MTCSKLIDMESLEVIIMPDSKTKDPWNIFQKVNKYICRVYNSPHPQLFLSIPTHKTTFNKTILKKNSNLETSQQSN